MLDIGYVFN